MLTGLDRLVVSPELAKRLRSERVALLAHPASVTRDLVHVSAVLSQLEIRPRVVFGPEQRERDNYKSWENGGALPSFVLEVTSRKTRSEDINRKFTLYERLGIAEYFLFDPIGDYLMPPLLGYRLEDGLYHPIPPENGDRVFSQTTGIYLVQAGTHLKFFDPDQNRFYPTLAESEANREQAERERQKAESERDAERTRAARLAERLRELGIDPDGV